MTKLGMDHRNEVDLQLDVKGSARIGKAVDATGFKRDLGEVMRDEAKDFAEIVKEIAGVDAVEGGATAEEVGDATAGQESQEKTEASPSLPTSEPQSSSDGQQ